MLGGIKWLKRNRSDLFVRWPRVMPYNQDSSRPTSHVEIELSGYQRLPDGENLSPRNLLRGESSNSEVIADLDCFFERLYTYYCEKGLWCIVIQWIVELLSLGFTICFSGFFLLFVNWHGLQTAKCGIDALEEGSKPCNLVKEALNKQPLKPFTFYKAIVLTYLIIFSLYWIFCFLRFFTQLKETLEIHKFYSSSLGVTDRELQTSSWPSLLDKIVQFQRQKQLCVVRELSAHDVVMRIMRKENYLIGMLNKGVLGIPIPSWVPGAGPVVIKDNSGVEKRLLLTKTLEWCLYWCILQNMFNRNFSIRREFTSNPAWLKKRLMAVGFGMLLLSPFLIIFMFVYFFLRHAEEFYRHPSIAASRRWSNLAKWIFREFNELDHLFKQRLNSSFKHAVDYVKQFPSVILSLIAKFVAFVAGGLAAVLIMIAFLDESLLEAHLFGRNLFWFAAVFGTITAISRSAIMDEFQVFEPGRALQTVAYYTHYMPKHWRGAENKDCVRAEVEALFQYTGMMLLEELMSIFVTPYILIFLLPQQVDDLMQFIRDFTVHVEGVGDICSLSLFDFERHGNSKYGSPFQTSKDRRSCQGKMEKSFLSFTNSYPNWEPDANGKQLLSILAQFQLQNSNLEISCLGCTFSLCSRLPSSKYAENVSHTCLNPILGHHSPVTSSHRVEVSGTSGNLNDYPSKWCKHMEQNQLYWLVDQFYASSLSQNSILKGVDNHSIKIGLPSRSLIPPSKLAQLMPNEGCPVDKENINVLKDSETYLPSVTNRQRETPEGGTSGSMVATRSYLEHFLVAGAMKEGESSSVQHRQELGDHWWSRAPQQSSIAHGSFLEPSVSMLGAGAHFLESNYETSPASEINHGREGGFQGACSSLFDDNGCEFNLPFGDVYEQGKDKKANDGN